MYIMQGRRKKNLRLVWLLGTENGFPCGPWLSFFWSRMGIDLDVPLLPYSHLSQIPQKKTQPRSQGLLTPVMTTARFFLDPSLLSPAA